ncbi:putative membrane protein [Bacillus clarus]|uniref:Putative membrane protein n=1 Tax=Bacillus clarus TaxID=2338372 RepID=A0A090Y9Z3_9BACI|nr:putative membrane protein [Bacillus clarus]
MFGKFKFYLIGFAAISILGGIIVGANFLFHNIYRLIVGKEI